MKSIATLALMAATLSGFAQTSSEPAAATLSPAERTIAQAQKLIDKNPKNFEAYNALALALSRRARETSDVSFYVKGEEAIQRSFEISPNNFDGQRTHVWLLLGKHEFAAARDEAQKLNEKMPDDVMVYGFLTDSNVELGNYPAAEKAAQWMLDLRPANLPGLTRAAYLRELYGDIDGAIDLMTMAYESTPPSEREDGAWILTQIAHLKLATGKIDDAEKLLQQALTMFPNYHYALGNMAKVRIQQKRYNEAVELLQLRYKDAPHAENLFDLAEALRLGGRTEESQQAFHEFERKSLLESMRADNSNHELIFYYADYANDPAQALLVAQREYARRQDVFTRDSYAWALYKNGRYKEATEQMETALAIGIRDTRLFRHAGEIALKSGNADAGTRYLQLAAQLNTVGSEQARSILGSVAPPSVGR